MSQSDMLICGGVAIACVYIFHMHRQIQKSQQAIITYLHGHDIDQNTLKRIRDLGYELDSSKDQWEQVQKIMATDKHFLH